MPGPVPKRSEERRRANEPAAGEPTQVVIDDLPPVVVPAPDESWHPIAQQFYESAKLSGQHKFYEPSDWALLFLICESMSRDLNDQFVGTNPLTGEPILAKIPLKGASLAAYLKACATLLIAEGDRRRLSVELQRTQGPVELPEGVSNISDKRIRRLAQ